MFMVIFILLVTGLCFGSFINAFVWRLHEKKDWLNDRSECIYCHHKLAAIDLIPVISWLLLRGKCRYCRRSISVQYPIVELITTVLFIASFLLWPIHLVGYSIALFALWLVIVIGLVALALYDIKWMILPSKLIYFLYIAALLMAAIHIYYSNNHISMAISYLIASLIGGGIFYILFLVSKGKWIGGGDVRLGFLLGLIVSTAQNSLLLIFIAAFLGTLVSIPFMLSGKLKKTSMIPFGPFLIAAAYIVQLEGFNILTWYSHVFLGV